MNMPAVFHLVTTSRTADGEEDLRPWRNSTRQDISRLIWTVGWPWQRWPKSAAVNFVLSASLTFLFLFWPIADVVRGSRPEPEPMGYWVSVGIFVVGMIVSGLRWLRLSRHQPDIPDSN